MTFNSDRFACFCPSQIGSLLLVVATSLEQRPRLGSGMRRAGSTELRLLRRQHGCGLRGGVL